MLFGALIHKVTRKIKLLQSDLFITIYSIAIPSYNGGKPEQKNIVWKNRSCRDI